MNKEIDRFIFLEIKFFNMQSSLYLVYIVNYNY